MRGNAATFIFKVTRSQRNDINTMLADPASTLNLKAFAECCDQLDKLIAKADRDGVWMEPQSVEQQP